MNTQYNFDHLNDEIPDYILNYISVFSEEIQLLHNEQIILLKQLSDLLNEAEEYIDAIMLFDFDGRLITNELRLLLSARSRIKRDILTLTNMQYKKVA